uniref:Tetraspanin family n=1 Tax=Schistocephalus solidus TaxID=70667 RepID=A0A0X3NUG4_SCHSO
MVVIILIFLCGIIVGLFRGIQRMQTLGAVKIHQIYDAKNHPVNSNILVFLTETQLSCCGRDMLDFYPIDHLPISCCADRAAKCTPEKAFKTGCVNSMKKLIYERLTGFTIGLFICIFPLLGAIINGFALFLYHKKVETINNTEFNTQLH